MERKNSALLKVDRLTRRFGGVLALNDLSFEVSECQIKSIIGPNGAGKTTLFNLLTGLLPPSSGRITYGDREIGGKKPYVIARMGVSRSFQNVEIFDNMSVMENVMLGFHCRTRYGAFSNAFRRRKAVEEEKYIREEALQKMEIVGLGSEAHSSPASLPFGKRRLVEFARALATSPKLLLLDEPASGLNMRETDQIANLICKIRDSGVTVMLVEHDMSVVMEISDHVLVLDFGTKIAEGKPRDVQRNEEVIARYLGRTNHYAENPKS
ncbi:MAG: ABC transporter ATP-binding protein [Candidatus Abyssobacteria bacterium SURF_5]|uniref:ABC transporter ATP-binding protein n=1 Tax=Abyssobacteria bacterium (strain SURF_5) TaxID=2093360 RepID=A0A3A4NQ29_ABYX5|nr:MAG: ABC transporter ATP-binding protein [Candidatus Abyssubacteria bacterium SURF_5]